MLCMVTALSLVLLSGCSTHNDDALTVTADDEIATENSEPSVADCPVDLYECMNTNSDVYAYIVIPDTNISYPILQSDKDDNYYLRRDWTGKNSYRGCIFSQSINSLYFTDPVTVLYGHNTDKGDMFSQLLYFKDEEFFNNHRYFYIYTPEYTLMYEIFSAHTFDNRHIMNSYDFYDEDVFVGFQKMLLNPPVLEKQVRNDVVLDSDSHILTLSTCAEARSGCKDRYLVNGVLVSYAFTN